MPCRDDPAFGCLNVFHGRVRAAAGAVGRILGLGDPSSWGGRRAGGRCNEISGFGAPLLIGRGAGGARLSKSVGI